MYTLLPLTMLECGTCTQHLFGAGTMVPPVPVIELPHLESVSAKARLADGTTDPRMAELRARRPASVPSSIPTHPPPSPPAPSHDGRPRPPGMMAGASMYATRAVGLSCLTLTIGRFPRGLS